MTDRLRPQLILDRLSKKYPNLWREIDRARARRTWPDWCFVPVYEVERLCADNAGRVPFGVSADTTHLALLAAWRATQGVYRFDPQVARELARTPVEGRIPREVLFRMPEWCLYVELDEQSAVVYPDGDRRPLHGFFASVEWDPQFRRPELIFLLDGEPSLLPIFLPLDEETIDDALASWTRRTIEDGRRGRWSRDAEFWEEFVAGLIGNLGRCVPELLSLVLYVCSAGAELREAAGGARLPRRPEPVRTKKGPRLFPAERPTVWECGWRTGPALRAAGAERSKERGGGTHARPRPHIRRGHWHHFWRGPRQGERELVVKWLPPVAVNARSAEDLVATVRAVGAEVRE